MLTIAFARANLVSYCLERELEVRRLNDNVQDDAIVRTHRTNKDRSFRMYKNYVDQVELMFEASVAIVLAKESYAFRSFVIKDYYFASSYNVKRRQVTIFVLFINFVTLSFEDVTSRCEDLVHILDLNYKRKRVEVLITL